MKNPSRSPAPLAGLLLGAVLAAGSPAQVGVVSLEFGGGTLTDLVARVKDAGENINILIPPEAGEVAVPELSLKEVGVGDALRAVASVCSNDQVQVDVGVQSSDGRGEPVFHLRVLFRGRGRVEPGSAERHVRVFSIRSLTDSLPGEPEAARITVEPDTILTAVDTGLEVSQPGGEKPLIRYHTDSGLLFVRGTWEQTQLVEEILSRMDNDLSRRRVAARTAGRGSGEDRKDR